MQGTVLDKIVKDKAVWVEARKQQQPLESFQNLWRVSSSEWRFPAVVFMTHCRAPALPLFWNAKKPLHPKGLFVMILILR